MFRIKITLLFGLLCFLSASYTSFAQPTHDQDHQNQKIEVMVLGTFHFHHAPNFFDISSQVKQKELDTVINSVAKFQPTKVALEAPFTDSTKFDSLYQQFKAGNHQLNNNERQQLGFRLADRLNHKTVYPIDHQQPWPYGEVMGWAKENSPEFLNIYNDWKESNNNHQDSLYKHATLTEILQWLNSESHDKRLDEIRIQRSTLGEGENYVGLKTLTSSYNRNLKIFANLTRYAEPGDRILVIYGSGHNYFLQEFVQMHPSMELVDVLDYLK